LEKTKIFFLNFRIVAGSLPYKPRILGIKISHGCREIAFCPVGYFNLSHPVYKYFNNVQRRTYAGALDAGCFYSGIRKVTTVQCVCGLVSNRESSCRPIHCQEHWATQACHGEKNGVQY